MAFSHIGATGRFSRAPVGFTEEQIRDIYGNKNSVNIHTGVITGVGLRHIEYDINTFGVHWSTCFRAGHPVTG